MYIYIYIYGFLILFLKILLSFCFFVFLFLLFLFQAGHVCSDEKDLIDGHPTGAVRISFGSNSTESDVKECIKFIQNCFIEKQFDHNLKDTSPQPQPSSLLLFHSTAVKTHQELPPTILEAKRENSSNFIPALHPMEIEENHFPVRTIQRTLSALFVYPVKSCAGMKVTFYAFLSSLFTFK